MQKVRGSIPESFLRSELGFSQPGSIFFDFCQQKKNRCRRSAVLPAKKKSMPQIGRFASKKKNGEKKPAAEAVCIRLRVVYLLEAPSLACPSRLSRSYADQHVHERKCRDGGPSPADPRAHRAEAGGENGGSNERAESWRSSGRWITSSVRWISC